MSSGESIDPRVIEAALDQCPAVLSEIISSEPPLNLSAPLLNLRVMLRSLPLPCSLKSPVQSHRPIVVAPPLRISWARVLVLKGQQIPITKKGAIFRKKFSATNFHASLTVLGMNPRPTSNLLRILPRARLRIKLPTLFRKSLLRF